MKSMPGRFKEEQGGQCVWNTVTKMGEPWNHDGRINRACGAL